MCVHMYVYIYVCVCVCVYIKNIPSESSTIHLQVLMEHSPG